VAYTEIPCTGVLTEFVECEWIVSSTRQVVAVYPDGSADLVFDESGRVSLVGVTDQTVRRPTASESALFGMRLKAGAIRALFEIPASEVSNKTVPIEDLPSILARDLTDAVKHSVSREGAISQVRDILSKRCAGETRPKWLGYGLSRIESQSVSSASASLNISERQLHRLFLREIGIGPARLKRVVRLQRTIDAMRCRVDHADLAGMAIDMGFTDQAHMSHEIKALTERTPTQLRADLQSS
jgi:AraC-like DNA-binding protein